HRPKVELVRYVALGQSTVGPDIPGIARLRDPKEVLRRSEYLRPCVPGLELDVMRQLLLRADQQTVVSRRPRILVGSNGGKPWIGPVTEIEEAGVRRIGVDRREVPVSLAKEPEAQDAQVADVHDEALADLALYRQVIVPRLRIAQIRRNG